MVNVGIIGAAGYTGVALIEILLRHPQARITYLSRRSDSAKNICEIFPQFKNRLDLACNVTSIKEASSKCDVVFLALPHTASMEVVPKLLNAGLKVIDLSADYRLKNTKVYKDYYQAGHKDKLNLKKAVYGLPELYRNKIKNSRLVANPGCYPTAALIALAPLLALDLIDKDSIIIDAKSGVTGAGKKITEGNLFSEINEDFKAYKVGEHQHAPEINQVLSRLAVKKVKVTFVPHLLPLNRGILETIYVKFAPNKKQNLLNLYKKFYKKEPFVRIKEEGSFPRLKDVAGTNFCDIGIKQNTEDVIIITAIDNLMKGASAQAVQNLNIMYKFPETSGLL